MCDHHSRLRGALIRWFAGNTLVAGALALAWLILRSGPRPSRLAYPCQRAALAAATLAFAAPLVATAAAARALAARVGAGPRGLAVAAVGLFTTLALWGGMSRGDASVARVHQPPAGYRAEVFHVTHCPRDPVGDRFPGLDNLLELMGRNGLKIYRSDVVTRLAGPDGLIAADDVVVVKINYQWRQCGGTNTDLLRGLIRVLLDHPDGFTGEVVVGENAQTVPVNGFDWMNNNAQDRTLSPSAVVTGFREAGHRVSLSDWGYFRRHRVEEAAACDEGRGYVVLERGVGGRISYPRFQTREGTCVDLRDGVWDPVRGGYDRSRLKVINLPVLKPHGYVYAVTGCVKNYMGVVTNDLGTGSHEGIYSGLLGSVMAEIGPPDLNIVDCIWIANDPAFGPPVSFDYATRLDQLVATTDPVAGDIWATTNILVPTWLANGHSPPWPYPDASPDDPGSMFRTYLDNSMEQLLAGGYAVTNDIASIDAVTWDGVTPFPRRGGGRLRP